MNTIAIENRKLLIIESAKWKNNYLDCDYVQECIENLEKSVSLDEIISSANELKYGIEFRGSSTRVITKLIEELSVNKQLV